MKNFLILFLLAHSFVSSSQCTNYVTHLTGTNVINGTTVTVTPSGDWGYTNMCTGPYFAGYAYNKSYGDGPASFRFNFNPPAGLVILDFQYLTNKGNDLEDVVFFVNGNHFPLTSAGQQDVCSGEPLAQLTLSGNLRACDGCSLSSTQGIAIQGPVNSLMVVDSVLSGRPFGTLFRLRFCTLLEAGISETSQSSEIRAFPNPFVDETTLLFDNPGKHASLNMYDAMGKIVRAENNIQANEIRIQRGDLNPGLYYYIITGRSGFANKKGKLVIR